MWQRKASTMGPPVPVFPSSASLLWVLIISVILCASSAFSFTSTFPTHTSTLKTSHCQHAKVRSAGRFSVAKPAVSTRLVPVPGAIQTKCSGSDPATIDVIADDGHVIKVWSKGAMDGEPIVLLHGRTWSARPVWDLQVGEPARDGASKLGASTMDMMVAEGMRVFCPDFRGLGGTARDEGGWTTPNRCADDVACVLEFLAKAAQPPPQSEIKRKSRQLGGGSSDPPLVGWSQGALVAHLLAQRRPHLIKALVLYGSIFDPNHTYPPDDVDIKAEKPPVVQNTMEGAMEDWTVPGLIDDEAAQAFGDAALQWDPRKVSWARLSEFNALDPAKLSTPTLVIIGQVALFEACTSGNKALRVVPQADHPAHLYPRERRIWFEEIAAFLRSVEA